MKKTFFPVTAGILLCIILTAGMWIYFQSSTHSIDLQETGTQERYDRHYVLLADDVRSGLWKEVYESAREEALKNGAYLELVGSDTMTDYTLEDYLRISIASQVDGIIMQPTGEQKIRDLIQEATENNIPVVTALEDDSESERISFVGINSYQMGTAYGEEILKLLKKEHTSVLILVNSHTRDTGTNLVLSQISNVVKEGAGEGRTVDISSYDIDILGNFDSEEAIREIFVNQGKIPDILVCLDEVITECACQAVVDYNQVENVDVIGYFTSDVILNAIEKGTITATVSFSTEEIGRYSVNALEEYHTLGHVSNYFNVGLNIINSRNIRRFSAGDSGQGE